jgi:hypothetical protein
LLSPETAGKRAGALGLGEDLTLIAEGLRLDPAAEEKGSFQISLDGVKRALWYQSRFSDSGGVQRAVPELGPARVRFRTERLVKPREPAVLRVFFEVDKAPADARLTFELGRFEGRDFVPDVPPREWTPTRRHVGFALGDGGLLLFEASIDDRAEIFTLNIRGKRLAVARLLDPANKELDRYEQEIVLDDQPPAIKTIEMPPQVDEGGPPFDARIFVTPPISGITEVGYITGTKVLDDEEFAKAYAEKKTLEAKRAVGNDDREWTARVTIPKDATGQLFITARAASGVGLTGRRGEVVKLRAKPMPVDEAAAAKKKEEPPAPGNIEGTVIEGPATQPNLRVVLMDPGAKDPAKVVVKDTSTDDDGKFKMTDIPPGEYRLFSMNDISKRFYDKPVFIKAGETKTLKLELLR